uniref:Uncharacterized protein n=1 Tax=Photinus pyralis TaxID=7054 RepID=A0A1Y1KQY9_PHOPY
MTPKRALKIYLAQEQRDFNHNLMGMLVSKKCVHYKQFTYILLLPVEIEIPETDDLQVSNEMIVEFANDHDYSSTVKPSATDDIENNGDKNWKKYTPNMLKRKKSAALCVNTTGKITFRNVL